MTQYLTHITIEGQRWDQLAWRYYRDVSKIGLLIESNPHAPITPTLPSGMTLQIPVIERAATQTHGAPPWKR